MATNEESKKHRLTVFLIKEDRKDLNDFINLQGLEILKIGESETDGLLVYKGSTQSKPTWVDIFKNVPGFKPHLLVNKSSKAIFAIKVEERWFCFTFGFSKHLIDDLAYERDFGLIVALNLGKPDAIKSIDKTNIGHISLHSKEQATREIELAGFEFDTDIDLLKSVTAKSAIDENDEQETYSGRDSVSISTQVSIDSFAKIAKKLLTAYGDTKYKDLYPWIDKIKQERDSSIVNQLDQALIDQLLAGNTEGIWLAIPEVIQWEHIHGFAFKKTAFSPKKPSPVWYYDLDLEEWLSVTKPEGDFTADKLKTRKVYVYWLDETQITTWSVYRCLNAELDFQGKKYILNDSNWYNIESNFVTEINSSYQAIPDSTIQLPSYGTQTEPQYLESVAASNPKFALMDRKEIMIGGGRSRVEFCDLYSTSKQIIHVKKYGGSSLLSHLFNQAQVSADCFLNDEKFRLAVNDKLPNGFKLPTPDLKPTAVDYEVCIAVMSKVHGPLELPFFSKVGLKYAARNLTNWGFRVTKLKIEQ